MNFYEASVAAKEGKRVGIKGQGWGMRWQVDRLVHESANDVCGFQVDPYKHLFDEFEVLGDANDIEVSGLEERDVVRFKYRFSVRSDKKEHAEQLRNLVTSQAEKIIFRDKVMKAK